MNKLMSAVEDPVAIDANVLSQAREVIRIEAEAISELMQHIDVVFVHAVKTILHCHARVIVCGMGKSGIIGHKISSTLASTGTPSFFMHPAEAFHGDLGVIKNDDVLLLISYSGETEEILQIIPFLEENHNFLIGMTGNPQSTLAKSVHCHLNVRVKKEACPLQMAPTSSTTAALVMGDALAIALMKERGFKAEDFARFHPGGNLGKRLLTKVEDIMITNNLPIIKKTSVMKDVIKIMTSARCGVAVMVDDDQYILGVITDGDLRRTLDKYENIFQLQPAQIITKNPKTINKNLKLYEAEEVFNRHEIISLIVSSEDGKLLGLLQYHDVQNAQGGRK